MLSFYLQSANRTIVFTGAGMSTESGLPDFRSASSGLWEQKDPSKVASAEALNQNVDQFFRFYRQRVLGLKQCAPHKGHDILAKWEQQGLIEGIITQNVDGFHAAAGSSNMMELHGSLRNVHCESCGAVYGNDTYEQQDYYCACGGTLRPSVVLFGEMLPEKVFLQAVAETENADLFIVLGSSLTVSPANQFPMLAKENGAKLVIVNQEPTPLDEYADLVIHDRPIGEVLSETDRELAKET